MQSILSFTFISSVHLVRIFVQHSELKMLGRKRDARGKSSRRMAKKTTPAALQTEVTNNEEWAKILEKKGLLDIYSEWSGPCIGMISILKKIKMEIGGDALSYAIAQCDHITDLERFRGKSEPTWMFINEGRMVNLVFGADCPQLIEVLTTELKRVQNGEPHEFSIPVSERSPEEEMRLKVLEENKIAKEMEKKAQKEAETKARYEDEMLHLTTSLKEETCILFYPWVFKDEEDHKREKKLSPPYVELVDEILPGNYTIEHEIRKSLDDTILQDFFNECDYILTESNKQLMMDGKCMFMRLKIHESKMDLDVHEHLLNLLFGVPELPTQGQAYIEGSFASRHKPASIPIDKHDYVFPVIWSPPNARNKSTVFRIIFNKYVNEKFPYEDKATKAPIIVFKYDSTKKNELKVVLEIFKDEVVNFGVFEYDKPPEAKIIATSIEEFELNTKEKTGYETFICVVKRIGCETFLSFAGIGPYHVSESPEKAIEESKLYFPCLNVLEEIPSDDEDKLETLEENDENIVNENKE